MATFSFRAITADGGAMRGTDTAESPRELVERLRDRGLLVTDVRPLGEPDILVRSRSWLRGPTSKHLSLLFRQLGSLLSAGMPMTQSLSVLENRFPHPELRRVLRQVRKEVEEGHALSTALARYPRYFGSLAIQAIHTGEAAGALDVLLARLSVAYEKDSALRQRLRAAAIYPSIVAIVALAAIVFLVTYVVPTLAGIYAGLHAVLPWQTRLLIAFGQGLRDSWFLVLVALASLVAVFIVARRTPWGEELADTLALSVPGLGRFNQQVIAARFCRNLATLLGSGVSLLLALETVAQSADNRLITQAVREIHEGARTGGRLGSLLARSPFFPSMLAEMVSVGEESGSVDKMLEQAADMQESDIEYTVSAWATALEPALILTMGVVVGFVVISMYLPLFDLVKVVR
jgi:type II secretory pathway component PulF